MKFYSINIISILFAITHIIHSKAEFVLTDEQYNSFKYGANEFDMLIVGDSGTEKEARQVMELSKFDALLHLGDFDYNCEPDKYFNKIMDSQRTYQFMGVLGNHEGYSECQEKSDRFKSNVYSEMVHQTKNKEVSCVFSESKWMWSCKYNNVRVIGLSSGVNGADKNPEQLAFLKKHLSSATEDWKICCWHFYDDYYHTGKYHDSEHKNIVSKEGDSFYDYCKDHGAIIFSAHDHVYARTHVMSLFKKPVIDTFDKATGEEIVQIRNGASFNILNGAGGYEMYIEQGEEKDYPHWQKTYAKGSSGENANKYGGLFCRFNVGGNNRKAYCEFRRINTSNKVYDKFTIYRNDNPETTPYTKIDDDFKSEKILAYKTANNIEEPIVDKTSNNTLVYFEDTSNKNKSGWSKFKDKLFTKTNIIIGGSVSGFLIICGVGLLFINKRKKITDKELTMSYNKSSQDDSSFFYTTFPDKPFDLNDSKTIDATFAPLPITADNKDKDEKKDKSFEFNYFDTEPKISAQPRYLNDDDDDDDYDDYDEMDKLNNNRHKYNDDYDYDSRHKYNDTYDYNRTNDNRRKYNDDYDRMNDNRHKYDDEYGNSTGYRYRNQRRNDQGQKDYSTKYNASTRSNNNYNSDKSSRDVDYNSTNHYDSSKTRDGDYKFNYYDSTTRNDDYSKTRSNNNNNYYKSSSTTTRDTDYYSSSRSNNNYNNKSRDRYNYEASPQPKNNTYKSRDNYYDYDREPKSSRYDTKSSSSRAKNYDNTYDYYLPSKSTENLRSNYYNSSFNNKDYDQKYNKYR